MDKTRRILFSEAPVCDRTFLIARFFGKVWKLTSALIPSWEGQGWVSCATDSPTPPFGHPSEEGIFGFWPRSGLFGIKGDHNCCGSTAVGDHG
jgi:hypothetical protein